MICIYSPSGGYIAGGTNVELEVKNLPRSGRISCKFGDMAGVPADYVARHIVKCVSPGVFESQFVAVEVSSNDQDYTSDMVQFHYQNPASVLALSPNSGPSTGYTLVDVYGTNFVDSSSLFCAFGQAVPTLWQRKGYRPETQCTYITISPDTHKTCDDDLISNISFTCFVRAYWVASHHIQCVSPPLDLGNK